MVGTISEQLECAELEDGDSENTSRCDSTLRPIHEASEYLELGEEWPVPASRREQVREARVEIEEWTKDAGVDLDEMSASTPTATGTGDAD